MREIAQINECRAEYLSFLVIPSLPGYGFSARPQAPGWDPDGIARAGTS
jgi:hypothetical protein